MSALNSVCIGQLTPAGGLTLAVCSDGGMKPLSHKFGTRDFKVVEVFEMSDREIHHSSLVLKDQPFCFFTSS